MVGLPNNSQLDNVPSTPKGLNDPFATEFTRKIRKVRERVLGERPQLRQSSFQLNLNFQDINKLQN